MESLYDYGEEEQDFYEETPGARKGYPIDHRSIKVSIRKSYPQSKSSLYRENIYIKILASFLAGRALRTSRKLAGQPLPEAEPGAGLGLTKEFN